MKNRSLLGFVLALFVALVVYLLQDAVCVKRAGIYKGG